MKRTIQAGLILPVLMFICFASSSANATTMKVMDLVERLKNGYAFEGEVLSVTPKKHFNGFNVLEYVFRVDDAIKPSLDTSIKLVNGGNITVTVVNGVKGIPVFKQGDRGIFLFYNPSKETGLASPVGWDQGVFKYSGTSGTKMTRVDPMAKVKNLKVLSSGTPGKNLEVSSKALGKLQAVSSTDEMNGDDLKSVMKGIVEGNIVMDEGGQQ